MAKPDLAPEQRGVPDFDFTLDSRAVRRNAAQIRKGLPPPGSLERSDTSEDVLSTIHVGGPHLADYFAGLDDDRENLTPARPQRIHDLPLDIDPQTIEEV